MTGLAFVILHGREVAFDNPYGRQAPGYMDKVIALFQKQFDPTIHARDSVRGVEIIILTERYSHTILIRTTPNSPIWKALVPENYQAGTECYAQVDRGIVQALTGEKLSVSERAFLKSIERLHQRRTHTPFPSTPSAQAIYT